MPKTSIIERIAAERKRKRRKRMRSKKNKTKNVNSDLTVDELERMKDDLEANIQSSKQKTSMSDDEATLEAIMAELSSKKVRLVHPKVT